MCLNCLPYYRECGCGISLHVTTMIITISQIILVLLLVIITFAAYPFGLKDISDSSRICFLAWFMVGPCITIVANIMAILVWTETIKHEDARDIILQVYFWFFVAAMVIHFFFCVVLMIFCYAKCLWAAIIHFAAFALIGDFIVYCMLLVNSYRMSLWM